VRSPLGIVVLILLVVILLGGGLGPRINPSWQYGYGTPGLGIVGVILIVFLLLWLLGYV
jgi:hypothetical protein